jgi:hypothetical protein
MRTMMSNYSWSGVFFVGLDSYLFFWIVHICKSFDQSYEPNLYDFYNLTLYIFS